MDVAGRTDRRPTESLAPSPRPRRRFFAPTMAGIVTLLCGAGGFGLASGPLGDNSFLWHLRTGLKPEGLVIVVDADRPVKRHGMPPNQLTCEFRAIGLQPVQSKRLNGSDAYYMAFRMVVERPAPGAIKPCKESS